MDEKEGISPDIRIRPLTMDDYEAVLKWSKDDIFCSANGWEMNRTPEELHIWWRMCVENIVEDFLRMGIECDGKLIGYADLAGIQDGSAELGIAIGESGLWGKGIGSRAAQALMDFAAEKLCITVFTAETNEANMRSRKMLEKIGFAEVGRVGREEYMGMDGLLIQYKLEK
ncbi:GNAT family N-acetyltransferase [Planococcus sp. CAU13]|uniref:GNAT family N-acetyltransferase n=1 Tax=Planococcus sp. CAU13 TaxID=1541197 RepID=UPI00052FF9C6|nr:GNAT family N-acetyltransferase [Planococcus sp. CAU13]